jgi:DNA-binding winged helix-turn-helix (wHTH) protein/TolB-like protein/Tfp pilus assembly protein PilF
MSNNGKHLREFDRFQIDLEKKVLWHLDEPVHLPSKAVELLCVLVENKGEVVTKDELLNKVWQDSFVEESVLAQNIHHLRKTFKDLNFSINPIQTIPRRGYRFASDVHEIPGEFVIEHEVVERSLLAEISEDSLKDLGLQNVTKSARSKRSRPKSRFAAASILMLAVLISAGFVLWSYNQSNEKAAFRDVKSIAVLPLINLNSSGQNQTFSLGLTDSLISRLGKLNRFAVRPFSAVEKYEKSGKDAISFGQELRVDSVLEGTIQTADNHLRVNLRLIDVKNGRQMWAENFDETASDILKLQDSISGKVAGFLLSKLKPEEQSLLAKNPTANAEAYRLYLTGRERWMRRDWTADSLGFYQKAIELDPNFALAYLGIADQYAFTYETKTAEDALNKAIELDPNLAEAHATRGFLQVFHHWDWPGAENSFRRALELAPNSSKAHHWFGVYLSLRGRFDEAQEEMEKALELDPTALAIMTDIAELHYFRHDYDRAENELEKVLQIDPNFINARANLIKVRYKKGGSYFLESAVFNVFRQKFLKSGGLTPDWETAEAEKLLAAKDEKTLREIYLKSSLEAINGKPDAYLSLSKYYSITGEKEKSLEMLEKACETKTFIMPFVAVDPLWDTVRDEPRFKEVLRKMNLH